MIISHSRGHKIYFDGSQWRYYDNNEPFKDERPCKRCGEFPTKDGFDHCLGRLEGVDNACCGHGVVDGYYIKA